MANTAETSISIIVNIDSSPPVVVITAPPNNAITTASVTVQGTATDNFGVAKVETSLDGGAFITAVGTNNWSMAYSNLLSGTHVVRARGTDVYGNISVPVSVSFTVNPPPPADTTPPTVSITSPFANSTVTNPVVARGVASDNVGVTRVEVAVDGGGYILASGTLSWMASLTIGNGWHTISARAKDAAGNISLIATVRVKVRPK